MYYNVALFACENRKTAKKPFCGFQGQKARFLKELLRTESPDFLFAESEGVDTLCQNSFNTI
jgi:hypothetical protein